MSKEELKKEKDRLTKKLSLMETTHSKQFAGHINEGAYEESCQQIKFVYQQLESVSDKLEDPVPVRF